MKNQGLITTLAVLLAVALSAIVALVVSSEVIGSANPADDVPTAVQIEVTTPTAPAITAPTGADTETQPAALETPEAPADPETPTDPGSADPAPADPDPVDPTDTVDPADPDPVDPDPVDPDPVDPDPPVVPEAPVDPDAPVVPECDGVLLDGVCIPPIHCLLGYDWIDGGCEFTGCPNGYNLVNNVCKKLGFQLPCKPGFVHNAAGTCVLEAVLVPGLGVCEAGLKWVDGNCVSVCPAKHIYVNGFCLPQIDPPGLTPFALPEAAFNS